jgi:2-oxoisovalerate dehydrogenase E1 component beta subunit
MTTRSDVRSGFTMADALGRALDEALDEDPSTIVMGEDVGRLGGVFRITDGLQEKYGPSRVVDTPLAEAGLVGTAIGLALNGVRPIVEIQFDGFIFPALNQICTHMAKLPARIGRADALPMVIRVPVGGRIRASELHSESPEAYFAHTPDLRVIAASRPETARGLLLAAIRSEEPFIFLEPKRLYRRQRIESSDEILDVNPGRARVVCEGDDALIVTYGPGLDVALGVSNSFAADGIGVAVLDLVSLAPIDEGTLFEHVSRSGRMVVFAEAVQRCSVASEVVALAATRCFRELVCAPKLVTSPNRPYPPADFEDSYLPGANDLTAAVRELLV